MDAMTKQRGQAASSRFNPRARDGRDEHTARDGVESLGFNPRARDGRDPLNKETFAEMQVSIHAPVMDAMA